ncbi:hypothetical protein HaLaN_30677, partial [Haematococcus lacustris]
MSHAADSAEISAEIEQLFKELEGVRARFASSQINDWSSQRLPLPEMRATPRPPTSPSRETQGSRGRWRGAGSTAQTPTRSAMHTSYSSPPPASHSVTKPGPARSSPASNNAAKKQMSVQLNDRPSSRGPSPLSHHSRGLGQAGRQPIVTSPNTSVASAGSPGQQAPEAFRGVFGASELSLSGPPMHQQVQVYADGTVATLHTPIHSPMQGYRLLTDSGSPLPPTRVSSPASSPAKKQPAWLLAAIHSSPSPTAFHIPAGVSQLAGPAQLQVEQAPGEQPHGQGAAPGPQVADGARAGTGSAPSTQLSSQEPAGPAVHQLMTKYKRTKLVAQLTVDCCTRCCVANCCHTETQQCRALLHASPHPAPSAVHDTSCAPAANGCHDSHDMRCCLVLQAQLLENEALRLQLSQAQKQLAALESASTCTLPEAKQAEKEAELEALLTAARAEAATAQDQVSSLMKLLAQQVEMHELASRESQHAVAQLTQKHSQAVQATQQERDELVAQVLGLREQTQQLQSQQGALVLELEHRMERTAQSRDAAIQALAEQEAQHTEALQELAAQHTASLQHSVDELSALHAAQLAQQELRITELDAKLAAAAEQHRSQLQDRTDAMTSAVQAAAQQISATVEIKTRQEQEMQAVAAEQVAAAEAAREVASREAAGLKLQLDEAAA